MQSFLYKVQNGGFNNIEISLEPQLKNLGGLGLLIQNLSQEWYGDYKA
jgi:hypothetical protein